MPENKFNLATDPWIKVMTQKPDTIKTVSLQELFQNAGDYRQLAGDSKAQDLAVLRLLLAILQTVYSRYTPDGSAYDWLTVDPETMKVSEFDPDDFVDEDDAKDLYSTWQKLHQQSHFTKIVSDYLTLNQARFDFFGDMPFYQVTAEQYDAAVPAKKRVATGSGTLAIKQMNRTISESNNTPAIFAPKTDSYKNQLKLDELVRWIIAYQNYTGVTDKTKVTADDKFSTPRGWLYGLNPVYASGENLFETLMLNMVLVDPTQEQYYVQQPVWEAPSVGDYIKERKKTLKPTNVAVIYTAWSRLLYLDWSVPDAPQIFSAGLPMFDADDVLVEPMTTWRHDKKTDTFKPAAKSLRNLDVAMWRHFGDYVASASTDGSEGPQPGLVSWIQTLQNKSYIPEDLPLQLITVALISDGNATSQAPAAEISDEMTIRADVLFDENPDLREHWPVRIENTIKLTQKICKYYWGFLRQVSDYRGYKKDDNTFPNQEVAKLYALLNAPFNDWLTGLTNQDDRDAKINDWKIQLKALVRQQAQTIMQTATTRDIRGKVDSDSGESRNIFTARNMLFGMVNEALKKG